MQGKADAINPVATGQRIAAAPPLVISGPSPDLRDTRDLLPQSRTLTPAPVSLARAAPPPAAVRQAPTLPDNRLPAPPPVYPEPPLPAQPAIIFDNNANTGTSTAAAEVAAAGSRVTAKRFVRPSYTVPQGTVIPAVLETALDSTRPGAARALVQRNVYGFDGTRILVPRGSRLYGEYDSGLEAGQNRALVQWTRLIRPDGVTIALDSPSSDPLGRAGIRGSVDSKFLQRFGGAILQSVLDIGVGLATQEVGNGVVVALPGSTQNVQIRDGNRVQRTLKIKHGTSVSVFVARDLDFSTVDS
ncbi:conjugal transfer protein TrbI [Altererythrobacter aquaemixtae]|uniref:Conjugal transfer protein TrbI n=2 Tax=Pontixanthobacter aquaemixtae TaxID=1958940 RepID=A0A844ZZN0_9SPHN|nr:conjugal transfer protein TrbI [Pontixanthobacter aquaemixtae]